jgi:hypothetical protein
MQELTATQNGTGTFFVTRGTGIPTATASPSQTTIEVYVSYCPTNLPAGGVPRLGSNFSSPEQLVNASMRNETHSNSTFNQINSTNVTEPDHELWFGRSCSESAGICCPPDVKCDHLGKCPWAAMRGMEYLNHGDFMVTGRDLSDGSTVPIDEQLPNTG